MELIIVKRKAARNKLFVNLFQLQSEPNPPFLFILNNAITLLFMRSYLMFEKGWKTKK